MSHEIDGVRSRAGDIASLGQPEHEVDLLHRAGVRETRGIDSGESFRVAPGVEEGLTAAGGVWR